MHARLLSVSDYRTRCDLCGITLLYIIAKIHAHRWPSVGLVETSTASESTQRRFEACRGDFFFLTNQKPFFIIYMMTATINQRKFYFEHLQYKRENETYEVFHYCVPIT